MIFALLVSALVLAVLVFMNSRRFGAIATGERLKRIKRSAHYREGSFQNLHHTPTMTEGVHFFKVLKEFIFDKSKRLAPAHPIPSKKTNLQTAAPDEDFLVWFGHSSYYMQVDGKNILVDPVLSGNASPFSFTTKSYPGTDVYSTDDFPEIDYLFITHDHWDHLDYRTVLALKPKVRKIITGLGTGAHFERWGFEKNTIGEYDWNNVAEPDPGFVVHALPARHFSGRGLKRNQVLWMSFALITPTKRIYIGGDSGYDTHFEEIGKSYGPFDLAVLECGQYNRNWKYIHMMPEQTVAAAIALRAETLLPVHWAKFSLSQHAWDEPIIRATAEAAKTGLKLAHPMIGAKLNLDGNGLFDRWWERV